MWCALTRQAPSLAQRYAHQLILLPLTRMHDVCLKCSPKHGMTLLYPEVLKLEANCGVVCFDKTGTFTGTPVGWLAGN